MKLREEDLTSDGIIAANPCVAIRNEAEINYGDEIVIKKLNQIVDDEIGAVRTKRLIIEFEGDFVGAIIGGWSRWKKKEGRGEEENEIRNVKEGTEFRGRLHWLHYTDSLLNRKKKKEKKNESNSPPWESLHYIWTLVYFSLWEYWMDHSFP